ncbi:hypothetical protein [Metabacillus fastidiosus]|uniref:hypothetical protein n=1 Tax=Metabacillus fastidiosus TaxID=1458 RepID=UPI002DB60AC1|nr:hypothetical protein [Metabacillus fastidiosus]MEC2078201.1 hypothetical protein [Metabacillus fastidiosus]
MKKLLISGVLAAGLTLTGGGISSASIHSNTGNVSAIDLTGMDLEAALMQVQSQRAALLEAQLQLQIKDVQERNNQIAKLHNELQSLNTERANTADIEKIKELDAKIAATKGQIDTLSNVNQMDMLRLQGMSNKRNEAFDVMTNFIKKMQESRSSIIGNMR